VAVATLGFGIAGLGRMGATVAPAFKDHAGVRLVAGADLSQPLLDRFTSDFQATGYTSFEALCADRAVEVVCICTPTHLHTEHVLTAIEHGKHVLVAKPMALTLADADRLIAAAERTGVQLIEAHPQTLEPPVLKMRELVRGGELGPLQMVHTWYYNDWLYRPRLLEELDTALGGGVTFRQGAHQFDILRLLGGGLVRSVRAATGVWDASRPTEGSHTTFLDFESGVVATAVYNGYDHFHTSELTYGIGEGGGPAMPREYAQARLATQAVGSAEGEAALKGTFGYGGARAERSAGQRRQPFYGLTVVSCERGDVRQSPEGLLVYAEERQWNLPLPLQPTGRDTMIEYMRQAVLTGQPALHHGRWAKATLEVSLAVLQSARERREIALAHQVPVAGTA
jgi:phthalate 4,5-cis-dihydrodiol dehydrogenase